ncbi:Lipoprotein-releasing system ATP-binding protein LolD [Rosistilla oblonga]|uniref:ABC transporter ATP-binding protein n=1 Tax=Rosistilla oblonga TaxID=2527990 RepID=UPI00118967E6|nr:ATP-binding cassette domain-containing protein [Rosistilla oblonga]QDV15105.1 Lipoprotein-releasing system ATP-binding protein LolD [Rosistilla oblonga]
MAAPLLTAEQITRRDSATGRVLIDRVSMSIAAGERIGLVGSSGAGKTVLMRSMVLLDPVQEGRILWQGQPVVGSEVPGFRSRAMYLPQLVPVTDGTVEEFLRSPFEWKIHRDRRYDADRIAAWIDACGLNVDLPRGPMMQASGGERQLFALLRALQLDPIVVLFDEATASMDAELTRRVEAMISDWQAADPQRSIVWTSHSGEQIDRMTDRQIQLQAGQVVGERHGSVAGEAGNV